MSKELDDGIERRPADDNPWYLLMQQSISLDKTSLELDGWHWLIFIHYIIEADLASIQKELPEEHPLKLASPPTSEQKQKFGIIIDNFYTIPGHPDNIQKIDFSNLFFDEEVNFSNFIFPLPVDFTDTDFNKIARFDRAFFYQATFVGTRFFDIASFLEIQTLVEINFRGAVFYNIAYFMKSKFRGVVNFSQTTFSSISFFNAVVFEQMVHFINTQFKVHVPNFYNAKISADIIWECDVNYWPKTEEHEMDKTDAHHRVRIKQNRNAYENIVSHMKKLDKYHDEHFFYRQEMRCHQQLEKNPFIRFPNTAYEWLANYGYGFGYALSWWLGHIFIGAILIGATTKSISNKTCDLAGSFYLDMIISFSNAHGVLFFSNGLLKDCYETFKVLPAFKFIWGIQTILGIIFLFLVLLTLRIRFRLK